METQNASDWPPDAESALNAIHDEALRLSGLLRERDIRNREVSDSVDLILSLAKHGYDVRTEEEKERVE